MIQITPNNEFILSTRATCYVFRVLPTGQLEHLYYGKKLRFQEDFSDLGVLAPKREFAPGNTIAYDGEHPALVMEDTCLEVSSYGKGDLRSPLVTICHGDGGRTSDFRFDAYAMEKGKPERKTLPGAYADSGAACKTATCETLHIVLREVHYQIRMDLYYTVFEAEDVITRYVDLTNESEEDAVIERIFSLQLDLGTDIWGGGIDGIFFDGAWAREMQPYRVPLGHGMHVNRSVTGTSSNRANPFFMIAGRHTTEDAGECYGFNLIYSGNHAEIVDANSFGKLRILSGINDEGFRYRLDAGECFEAPEAVMSYAEQGFNELSAHFHGFVRNHIIRGTWKDRNRPILLNSWEAAYFKFDEAKLLKLAKKAADVGVELFVMDDGWFGERDDDTRSLGDWEVNIKKLPGGLKGLVDKINDLGLSFGIWVEPEMVNVSSRLYEAHPDWCLCNPETPHSEGRNQRILDLTRTEVREYVVEAMTKVFSSARISYVKWDMNRIFSDVFSQAAYPEQMGEIAHRYVLGLYEIMGELTRRFPEILFEGCASGGNRFDLGILCYFPQIWGSDNTDPICRADIQTGYSYGYPQECVGAHVSASPNHQTLRRTPMRTRFAVAAFGSLGYECNLCDLTGEQLEEIKADIAFYKKYRSVLQHGNFYRGSGTIVGSGQAGGIYSTGGAGSLGGMSGTGNFVEWTTVAQDGSAAVGMTLKKLVTPNTQHAVYRPKGLLREVRYHFTNREAPYDIRDFGDLVNTVAPVHIRPDSLVHAIVAKKVKLPAEKEDYTAYGSLLCETGVQLKQNYSGTGFNENVRYEQDFSAKLFVMERSE